MQRLGVTTAKSSPTLTLVVHLISPNDRYDITYLRNYAILNVKDRLARITGVGEVTVWGSGNYSMRVWLDPQKVAQRGMTAGEVVSAIREQNVQVAAGVIGASPTLGDVPQLQRERARPPADRGRVPRHHPEDLARRRRDAPVRRGAWSWTPRNTACARCWTTSRRWAWASCNRPAPTRWTCPPRCARPWPSWPRTFPGVEYRIEYDPTQFVSASIEAVVHTLLEAIALVVLVVILFLQTWRASIIPLAVPVSIVGTFALLLVFGYSINALSLFGMVLAIGIVVDDAIVVVENVERNIAAGLTRARRPTAPCGK